jgi:hypothetical protein
MVHSKRHWSIVGGAVCTVAVGSLVAVLGVGLGRAVQAEVRKDDPALERTRAHAKMLDDVFKITVVDITNRYDGPPAAKVAKAVFAAADQKGYFSARLVDLTGSPLNEDNVPKSDFEKRAAEVLHRGKAYYEEVVGTGQDRRLLVASAVPAVVRKCARCHGVEQGALLGFLRYDLPVK